MSFFLTLKTKCYDDKTFGNKKAVILRNHGLVTVGKQWMKRLGGLFR
jgi:ribulose-5-phosphate 4-epimerase/fuculose-1-phosphate aldolase